MESKIELLKNQKEILKKYIHLIEEECANYIISYVIDEKRNSTSENEEKYKNFFMELDKNCNSEVFKKLCDFIYQVPKTCSFITFLSGDGGTTTYEYNGITKEIMGCKSIDLPPFNRASMDFIYLHEAVHGLFWDSRKGKQFVDTPDIEVLPYFFMLYALHYLHNNYQQETINSILGRFIANSYYCANSILEGLDNNFLYFSEQELNQNFRFELYELENIRKNKIKLYSDYQQFLGPIKSIILYNYCLIDKIPFEIVLDSVLDVNKIIGTELDYELLDISTKENFNTYKNFVKQKKLVLPLKNKIMK